MTDLRVAAQQALEALELVTDLTNHDDEIYDAIDALRAALAEPVQEPLQSAAIHAAWSAGYVEGEKAAWSAQPQEPDSPERRCGGPGCDGTCCQPVQEPVAGVVLNEEGRAALVEHGREEWHCVVRNARRLYTAPPQRKPLSGVAIYGLFVRSGLGAYHQKDFVVQTEYDRCIERFARAIERAHGITP